MERMGNCQCKALRVEFANDSSNIDEILEVVEEGIAKSVYHGIEYDQDVIRSVVEDYAFDGHSDSTLILLKEIETERVVGVLLATITTQHPLFHKGRVANEILWYIKEDFRGTRKSIQMLQTYEDWALVNGATHITCGSLNNESRDMLHKVYTHRGMKLIELYYMKEIG
jgi:hypothetical protein